MPQPLRLQTITGPTVLPIGLDEIKAQLGIDDDLIADDALLMAFVGAATEEAELVTGRSLISRTLAYWLDAWPVSVEDEPIREGWSEGVLNPLAGARELVLPRPPLSSVTSISTFDDDDVETVFAASNYFVDTASVPGRVVLRSGASAPVTDRVANGVKIVYAAGYGAAFGDVPEAIREGIKRTATWLYNNRGDCDASTAAANAGAMTLWQKYRIMRI
jgi:uncharacterized phiE125 gp8 family phage protein